MFKKVMIANRGEIAIRIIRACRELGIQTVAVYSEADRDALHVRMADEAVRIGPAPSQKSYLNIDAILKAARETQVDAIHPGYGFLSENPAFSSACREAGITFIGPTAEMIERMGNKAVARQIAEAAGIPVVPGTREPVSSFEEALKAAEQIGYPLLIKAAAGGGGRGIRSARSPKELAELLPIAQEEARAFFGDGGVYLEKQLVNPRHVEIQILGDGTRFVHLYERECSVQRRRQKILEEGPSAALTTEIRERMGQAALKMAQAVGYTGVGTVEFLVDANGDFYFIEMNTRIQVAHPVTEAITGVDLIQEQIRISAGYPLRLCQEDIQVRGWAIECRINAEDPDRDFMPCPGMINAVEFPGGPGVRIDAALYPGCVVQPYYDSLIAKLIVWAPDREGAIRRAVRALQEFRIEGVKTTIPFLLRVLQNSSFQSGQYHTGILEHLV